MKKFIWISFLMILIGCGSRKVKTEKQSEKFDTKTEQKTETKSETTSEKSGETSYNLTSDLLNFNIEPINGIPAVFSFDYNGKKISGETTGKLNFSNEKRKEEIQTKFREVIQTTHVTKTNYQTHTTYKTVQKSKETEREPYPVIMWIGLGIVITVLVQLLWKVYKPKL